MIPSLDTYLYKEIKERLRIILSECYIINESLREIDTEARENFIDTYCGENPKKEILVSYTFPQSKEQFDSARIVIAMGGSTETKKTIGGVQGTYTYSENDFESETVTLEKQGDRWAFPTTHPVGDYFNSADISFSDSDDFQISPLGVASFAYTGNEHLENVQLRITYSSKKSNSTTPGLLLGYTSLDQISIVPISTNVDIVRCLDMLLRVVLITMRDNHEEKIDFALQSLEFGDLQPVIDNGETVVFGRPCTLGYTVTNSVSFDLTNQVKEFIARRRYMA